VADDDVLLPAAASISDGEPVDWSPLDAAAGDTRRQRLIAQLRIVAQIADVYRRADLASESREPAPSRFGHLRVLEPLARGGFGAVYRAWDTQLEREVALKLLRPSLDTEAEAALREGRLQARVRHPHVVTVYGADRIDGRTGLWMELIHGQTLADLVRERGMLGAGEAIVIGLDLCRALAAVHAAGLVHRDVKAQNAMREQGGRIVLMDLGLGRPVRDDAPTELSGTPSYMAPELVQGAAPASVRSDIYSLGVLLFHLVTGALPVEGRDLAALRAAHGEGRRRHLRDLRPDLPSRFVAIVERSLAPLAEDRYASAGALEVALSQAAERSTPGAAANESPAERETAGDRRPRLSWLLAGLAALAVWTVSTGRAPDGPDSATPTSAPVAEESAAEGELLESLTSLASLHQAMGAYAEAASLHERALEIQQRELGGSHPEVAHTLTRLAWARQSSGEQGLARAHYERALAIYRERLGLDHPLVATSIERLAALSAAGTGDAGRVAAGRAGAQGDPFVAPLDPSGPLDEPAAGVAGVDRPYGIQLGVTTTAHGFRLEHRATRPLWVYVLSQDQEGEPGLLFPLPGVEPKNPLAGGERHLLPGRLRGREVAWTSAEAGGGGRLLVIASPAALFGFENEIRALRLPRTGPLRRVPLTDDALDRLQAALDATGTGASAYGGPERLFDLAQPAQNHLELVRGVWIRRVEPPGRPNPQPFRE